MKEEMTASGFLVNDPSTSPIAQLMLAHGAGAPMDSPFMNLLAAALAARGVRVLRFEFPYMAERRRTGGKRPPNPMSVLEQAFRLQAAQLQGPFFVGGKSMGGRVASMIYEQTVEAVGLVCLGYPFHPIGKPDRLRVEHLQDIGKPVLVIQGERDGLGNREQVAGYRLPDHFQFEWLCDGDHSFKPRKASGYTLEQHQQQAVEIMAGWIKSLR